MASLLQNVKRRLGQTVSEIAAPSLSELQVGQIFEPTIGWLPEENYCLHPPEQDSVDFIPIAASPERTPPLLSKPSAGSLPEDSCCLRQPKSDSVNVSPIASPAKRSAALVATPHEECLPEDACSLQRLPSDVLNGMPISSPTQMSVASFSVLRTFACPFRVESVANSHLPLLGNADTMELRAELQASTVPNRICRLTTPQTVSLNLNRLLVIVPPLPTEDCLAILLACFLVSDDLHKPLVRSARSDGKCYATDARVPQETSSREKLQTPALAFLGSEIGNRKSFEQAAGSRHQRVKRGMSVWDLILPLLQRPLNLVFETNVDLPSELYAFQTKGVDFLIETPSALLGDDMGTGKTVQAAVALRILFQTARIRTALIVCPLSVIPNWDRELAKWAENLAVTVVRGTKEHREICWRKPTHIWLTTYDTLRNDVENVLTLRKGGFDLIALDEAQRIKNWSAGVTRAVRQLQATHRWGLTGTPLENNTEELWTILNVLNPEISKGPLDWSQGIQSVLRPMFLRRRKQDVLTDLPPLVQNPVWVRLEYEQRKSYDQLENQGVLELHAKGETITAQSIIVLLNKLKQVCNRCPRSGESSKLVWLRDSLDDIAAQGDKILVFSQYRDERFAGADWLEKELADFGALNYSKATSDKWRKELLAAFKEKAEHKVFIGHPKVAGVGLNELVVANYVVHFDHWWNPAVMNQATARAHRPGQTKTVFAYDLWVEETYEEIIFKLLERKQELYNEVIDSMSAEGDTAANVAFAVADILFEKHGLTAIHRK